MACDGEIAPDEVSLIKTISDKDNLFGDIDINSELEKMVDEINKKGKNFLKEYLQELLSFNMTKEQELNILSVAYKMIKADKKIVYSEVKFFKIIKSIMKQISDDQIIDSIVGIEDCFLAEDNKNMDYKKYYDLYFQTEDIKPFDYNTLSCLIKQ